MNGIFIGRFQPFHNGHLDACKQILEKCNKLIIAISNPENSEEATFINKIDAKTQEIIKTLRSKEKNPFTYLQRKEMIEKSLLAEGIKNFEVVPFYGVYTHGITKFESVMPKKLESIIYLPMKDAHQGDFKKLFEKHGWQVQEIKINKDISGTKIRELIKSNKSINNFVPKAVAEIIKKYSKKRYLPNCSHIV